MKEIEAKFKVEDVELLRKKILEIAKFKSKKVQRDTYYNHSKKEELKDVPSYLRVRTVEGKSFTAMHYRLKDYVFLEINPNGQWLWLELKSGYPLSRDVARNLL